MMAINGRIQREGGVVHLVAHQLFDLSGDLWGLADRDSEFKLPTGRGRRVRAWIPWQSGFTGQVEASAAAEGHLRQRPAYRHAED